MEKALETELLDNIAHSMVCSPSSVFESPIQVSEFTVMSPKL